MVEDASRQADALQSDEIGKRQSDHTLLDMHRSGFFQKEKVRAGMEVARRDSLGDRMKTQYEDRTRVMLPRRTYTIIRVDGRAFHSWTRGMQWPYSGTLMSLMDSAAIALCKDCAGAEFAFVQSDEINVLLTDFRKEDTQAWFDGNLQKLASISASVATAEFNINVQALGIGKPKAYFDSRAFVIPDPVEVANYFIWRQKDAERNSVAMLAQSYASAKQLNGKDRTAQHDVIHEAGDNWNDHPCDFKRGRAIIYRDQAWGVDHETPIFVENREYLSSRIPVQWAVEG
jgi:tRNA(His) guanylyltransferase